MKDRTIGMHVQCSECWDKASVEDVNNDKVRYHLPNGDMIRFMSGTTQELINAGSFLCECCEQDRIEAEQEYY